MKIRTNPGKRKTTYSVRWTVGGQEFHKTYGTKAHAESRLAELRTAARKGEAFDIETGLPVSEVERRSDRSWYEHASAYVENRWTKVSGGQRRSIADAIATATPALLTSDRGQSDAALLRRTMYAWVCNMARRKNERPPEGVGKAMAWLARNTMPVAALSDQAVLNRTLDRLAVKLDGKPAAAKLFALVGRRTSRPVGRVLCTRRSGPTAIHLGLPLPAASCGPPASIGRATLKRSRSRRGPGSQTNRGSLLTLLQVGFTEPPQSPAVLVVSYTTVSPLPPGRSR